MSHVGPFADDEAIEEPVDENVTLNDPQSSKRLVYLPMLLFSAFSAFKLDLGEELQYGQCWVCDLSAACVEGHGGLESQSQEPESRR